MSRKRGRPSRHYRLRVRTVRRAEIDYDALARAALEQAAMEQREREGEHEARLVPNSHRGHQNAHRTKEPRHDRLA